MHNICQDIENLSRISVTWRQKVPGYTPATGQACDYRL
jgi:hypothetical protein